MWASTKWSWGGGGGKATTAFSRKETNIARVMTVGHLESANKPNWNACEYSDSQGQQDGNQTHSKTRRIDSSIYNVSRNQSKLIKDLQNSKYTRLHFCDTPNTDFIFNSSAPRRVISVTSSDINRWAIYYVYGCACQISSIKHQSVYLQIVG